MLTSHTHSRHVSTHVCESSGHAVRDPYSVVTSSPHTRDVPCRDCCAQPGFPPGTASAAAKCSKAFMASASGVCDMCGGDLDPEVGWCRACASFVLADAYSNPYEWSRAMVSETNVPMVFNPFVDVSNWCFLLFGRWGLGHVLTQVVAVIGFKMPLRPSKVLLSSTHHQPQHPPLRSSRNQYHFLSSVRRSMGSFALLRVKITFVWWI